MLRSAAEKVARYISAELGKSDRATIAERAYATLGRTEKLALALASDRDYRTALDAAMDREQARGGPG